MKTLKATIIKICLISLLAGAESLLFSQSPPPPPQGENPRTDGNRQGAPIDGGLGILLAMGAAYGGKKVYQAVKAKKEQKN